MAPRLATILPLSRIRAAIVAVGAQGLSSASNFGVQVGLAVTLEPSDFGSLVVGFAVYYLALAMVRALVGDPLVALARTSSGAGPGRSWRGDLLWVELRSRLAMIAAAATVLLTGLAVVVEPVRLELGLLAVAVPGLLAQDGLRARCWARSRVGLVLALDGGWVATTLAAGGVIVWVVGASASGSTILIAWLIGGLVSALVGWPLVRTGERVEAAGRKVDTAADLNDEEWAATRSLGLSQALLAADSNGLPVATAAVAGPGISGGIRAAALPFMPLATVVGALRLLMLPVLRRAVVAGHGPTTTMKATGATTVIVATMAGSTLVLLSMTPDDWLGSTGQLARPWFSLAAIVVAARLIALPLADSLSLSNEQSGRVVALRLGTTMMDWAATLTGAVVGGLAGAMQARTAAAVLALMVWVVAVIEASRRPSTTTSEESEPYVVA